MSSWLRDEVMRVTTGQKLKLTWMAALPVVEALATTLMSREAETAMPCESVTVTVRVWIPAEEGAVHEVVEAVGVEKVPLAEAQAKERVSPGLGS